MGDVTETQLPGVGVRYDFITTEGERVGVLSTRSGRRELLVYDRDDPDSCRAVIRLGPADTQTLSELMGASHVAESLVRMHQVEGITLDWLVVPADSRFAGRSLREMGLRATTGVSIVAVIRGERTYPAPGANFTIESGDTAVVVGTPEGILQAATLMRAP